MKHSYILFLAMFLPMAALAEPVKHIPAYVTPYYNGAQTPEGTPDVAVNKAYDALLRSNDPKDILVVSEKIKAEPDFVTPMTMMVLAIRLYDTGQRDQSVFWFYVAKDRYATVMKTMDLEASGLLEVNDAMNAFSELVGPFINGYAFCDIGKRNKTRKAAFQWVKDHPYMTIFSPSLKSKAEDRKNALFDALVEINTNIMKEQEYLSDANNLADLEKQRAENDMAGQYCWK